MVHFTEYLPSGGQLLAIGLTEDDVARMAVPVRGCIPLDNVMIAGRPWGFVFLYGKNHSELVEKYERAVGVIASKQKKPPEGTVKIFSCRNYYHLPMVFRDGVILHLIGVVEEQVDNLRIGGFVDLASRLDESGSLVGRESAPSRGFLAANIDADPEFVRIIIYMHGGVSGVEEELRRSGLWGKE